MTQCTRRPSRRILVADDDPENLRLMRSLVEGEDCLMVSASDGREAYRILAQDDDFLICIFAGVMPYLGGSELLGYMHTEKRFKRIPKIMMLAVEHSAIPAGNLAAGATAYLQKPISPMHMRAILHMLVNRSREHKGSAAFSVVGSMDIRPEPSL